MLRRRLIIVLSIAVLMGLITAYLVYTTTTKPRTEQAAVDDIVVAQANIAMGESVTAKHIKLSPWPKVALPPGSLRAVKDAEGRVARSSIVVGEPVVDSKLTPPGQGGLMPVIVPAGK